MSIIIACRGDNDLYRTLGSNGVASNADVGWGAWSIESGWTQGWIVTVLGLRLRNTSFWELTAGSRIAAGANAQWKAI